MILAVLSPVERKEWLEKHNAPTGYLLIHEVEASGINAQLRKAVALESDYRNAAAALGSYFETQPDLASAASAAMQDLARVRAELAKLTNP